MCTWWAIFRTKTVVQWHLNHNDSSTTKLFPYSESHHYHVLCSCDPHVSNSCPHPLCLQVKTANMLSSIAKTSIHVWTEENVPACVATSIGRSVSRVDVLVWPPRCDCTHGWSGKNCQTNDDDCIYNRCENGATCVDGINEYICKCRPGYAGKNVLPFCACCLVAPHTGRVITAHARTHTCFRTNVVCANDENRLH